MKSFDHPNVLDVIGVGFDTESGNGFPFMVLPFMANGDLKTFLKSKRQKPTVVDHLPKVCYIYLCCLFTLLLYTTKVISHSYLLPREFIIRKKREGEYPTSLVLPNTSHKVMT